MEWRFYGPHAVLIRFAERVGDEAFERSRLGLNEVWTQYLIFGGMCSRAHIAAVLSSESWVVSAA